MKRVNSLIFIAMFFNTTIPVYAKVQSNLPMNRVYQGPVHLPDFSGRDSAYARFKTKITEEMKTGPNFAGHYAIITVGCGTSCNFSFVGDVATGQVYAFPYGGEAYYMLQLRFDVKNDFVSVKWADGEICYSHTIKWNGKEFTANNKPFAGPRESCDY